MIDTEKLQKPSVNDFECIFQVLGHCEWNMLLFLNKAISKRKPNQHLKRCQHIEAEPKFGWDSQRCDNCFNLERTIRTIFATHFSRLLAVNRTIRKCIRILLMNDVTSCMRKEKSDYHMSPRYWIRQTRRYWNKQHDLSKKIQFSKFPSKQKILLCFYVLFTTTIAIVFFVKKQSIKN